MSARLTIRVVPFLLLIGLPVRVHAEETRLTAAFWNVRNLFDPSDDPRTQDQDFTPKGSQKWDETKLAGKIDRLAQVISVLDADVIGLAEVENFRVLRLLADKAGYPHAVLIDRNDPRGIDLGVIARVPLHNVKNTGPLRGFLRVPMGGITVTFAHWKSKMGSGTKTGAQRLASAEAFGEIEGPALLLADFNEEPRESGRRLLVEKFGLEELIAPDQCHSYFSKGKGRCLDGAYLRKSSACKFRIESAEVIRPEFMRDPRWPRPAPLIEYSDHWPVRVRFSFQCGN